MPDFQETLSESLLEKLNNFSFAEERSLYTVTINRDLKGSLGLQIMEGSDGKVYIQSVIPTGPADSQRTISTGDQIVSVNGRNLLSMKYNDALKLLKSTGESVDFVLSRIAKKDNFHTQATLPLGEKNTMVSKCRINLSDINRSHVESIALQSTINKLKRMSYPNAINSYIAYENIITSPIEKHITESCHDITNPNKLTVHTNIRATDVPYHKHIRYGLETDTQISKTDQQSNLNKNLSKSCTQIYAKYSSSHQDKAVIVDMIPKLNINLPYSVFKGKSDEKLDSSGGDDFPKYTIPHIPLPRSLGLSRKWRGPVKYPVTPIKQSEPLNDDNSPYVTTSDEEQVFI